MAQTLLPSLNPTYHGQGLEADVVIQLPNVYSCLPLPSTTAHV